jgi:acylphosphatase
VQNLIRAHVLIAGRVQGVAYRVSTWEVARRLGLNGWVKNLPDGRVEAVFEGADTIVQDMIRWCHQGPSSAVVEEVLVDYETPENLQDFTILR